MTVSGTKLDTDTVQPDIPASPGPQVPSSTPGPAPCHLTQNARQTRAMADSIASEQAIEEAHKVGKDWATDSSELTTRVVSYVSVGLDTLPELDEDGNDDWDNICRYESLRMNLAIAAVKDMEAWKIDYVAAYLNAKPQAMVYIKLPDVPRLRGK